MDVIRLVQLKLVVRESPPINRIHHHDVRAVALHRENNIVVIARSRPLSVERRRQCRGANIEHLRSNDVEHHDRCACVPAHLDLHDPRLSFRPAHDLHEFTAVCLRDWVERETEFNVVVVIGDISGGDDIESGWSEV